MIKIWTPFDFWRLYKGCTRNWIGGWLIDNTIEEARAMGDKFNLRQFESVNRKSIKQSDKGNAGEYLIGDYLPRSQSLS